MRTTLDLDDHLVTEAKRVAAERGMTLSAVVEDALRIMVRRASERRLRERPPTPPLN